MARQGLHQHRKFLRLARLLGSPYAARGALEMLWEPAYDSGDDSLGDADDVEARCGWDGEKGTLTAAFLECGFIEALSDEPGLFRIHDLYDHVPPGVVRRLTKEAQRRERGLTLSQIRSEAGRKGAKSRWGRQDDGKQLAPVTTHYTLHTTHIEDLAGAMLPLPGVENIPAAEEKPKPKAAGKEESSPNPRFHPLKLRLIAEYRELFGVAYAFTGKDAGSLSELLAMEKSDEEIVFRWRDAWRQVGFYRPIDIQDFKKKWNAYPVPKKQESLRMDPNQGIMRGGA